MANHEPPPGYRRLPFGTTPIVGIRNFVWRLRRHLGTTAVRHRAVWLVILVIPLFLWSLEANGNSAERYRGEVSMASIWARRISFQTIFKGYQSAVREPMQIIARNKAEWKALWDKHGAAESKPPAVDFRREIVIAVFLGEKPTGGHEIAITDVEQIDGKLVVSYVGKGPPPGGLVTQAFTQPFHIVRVAAQGSETVSFRRLP